MLVIIDKRLVFKVFGYDAGVYAKKSAIFGTNLFASPNKNKHLRKMKRINTTTLELISLIRWALILKATWIHTSLREVPIIKNY